jgi:hypothetical protein
VLVQILKTIKDKAGTALIPQKRKSRIFSTICAVEKTRDYF